MVDSNYNFECDWLIELSDNKLSNNKLSNNKLSDNNLASELVENRSFFKPITIEDIVIFMIKPGILKLTTSRGQSNLPTVTTVFIFVTLGHNILAAKKGYYRVVSVVQLSFEINKGFYY